MSGWQGDSVNEYGTPVSVLICTTCGKEVTVCPAMGREQREAWGTDCLTPDCPSYDVLRDMDIFFDALMDHGQVARKDAL